MSTTIYPDNFLLFNEASAKNLVIVVKIEGVPFYITSGPIFKTIRYGDPIFYGDPGLVYGGLLLRDDFKPYLNLDGSMVISQKVEPEQGRGAVTLLTLSFTDKDGFFSRLVSRGVVVDEPLGNKKVQVWLGYQATSFPEDYLVILRGYISQTTYQASKVTIQLSDPNIKRRGNICYTPKTTTTSPVNNSQTSIPVVRIDGFYDHVLGPDGLTYDPAITTYIKIDDEYMKYGPGDLSPTAITVVRGQRGSTAASHDVNASIDNIIQIQDNLINIALKTMISGWSGPYTTGQNIRSLADTLDPGLGVIPGAVLLPEDIDAIEDLGIAVGDWITISGSTMGNDGTFQITEITDALSRSNRLLNTTGVFIVETPLVPGALVMSIRSQYDTYPVAAGAKISPIDIDVDTFQTLRNQFLAQGENRMRFLITEATTLKSFIESELLLPVGAYSITRYGKMSMALTKPPLAAQKLIFLDKDTVKDAPNIVVMRGLNNRRYFSEIDYYWDILDDGSTFTNTLAILDTESLSKTDTSSVLPVKSKGLKSDLNAQVLIDRRGQFLLNRYKNVATELTLKVNFKTIAQIETGDVVAVRDDGHLKLLNYETGERNLGTQMFEVIRRDIDLKNGDGTVTVLGNIGVQATDRFATISPSSLVDTDSTTTSIRIKESFGSAFPGNEGKKWKDYVGLPIFVHNLDYSIVSAEVTFLGIDPGDSHRLLVDPALGFTPSPDMIVEIAKYDTGNDSSVNALYKLVHCYIDLTTTVTSWVDALNFFVSLADAADMNIGQLILVHNTDYSILSPEVTVTNIDTGTGQITVDKTLGFTPSVGQKIELNGFKDFGFSYRIL